MVLTLKALCLIADRLSIVERTRASQFPHCPPLSYVEGHLPTSPASGSKSLILVLFCHDKSSRKRVCAAVSFIVASVGSLQHQAPSFGCRSILSICCYIVAH